MAYDSQGNPLYDKFDGVARNLEGGVQAKFRLIRPVNRREDGVSRRVTHDTYTADELAELIADLRREGRDVTMFRAAKEQLDRSPDRSPKRRGLMIG